MSSAVIAEVNQLKGHVSDKKADLWMDDGEGGKPATSAPVDYAALAKQAGAVGYIPAPTTSRMFSQADCDRAMQKKIAELKGD